ncbi:NADP oxidoreductase [Xiamenia xianingshaonis]|uniref:NADP oxidoreductase n=1 Tax=Xiamenia xianingshaonis TaxID=2682776 RepID=A0A9E6SV83_9ACTN|nr:NADP oxidoreductase [Xiamenia xianingshaonis]NHM14537.1 NADP oxidoreductase [Xiamenia xianingshaonis]QTU85012.1 NADP oxidoreductase [Xiamenia xianingshaonis]
MDMRDFMEKHGLTDEDLDRMAEPYERGECPHSDAPMYSGSHLDRVGKKRVTVVYDAVDVQAVSAVARKRGVKPSVVYRDALKAYLAGAAGA